MKEAERSYVLDPVYNSFVNNLMDMITKLELTPYEIRQAAVFAAIKVEQLKTSRKRVIVFNPEDEIIARAYEEVKPGDLLYFNKNDGLLHKYPSASENKSM